MKSHYYSLGLLTALAWCLMSDAYAQSPKTTYVYPTARKEQVVEDYHGTKVADPYRWLEDPDSPETKAWVEAQNAVTFKYLEALPARQRIKDRLTKLWDYEKFGTPGKEGNRYFFSRNSGLQNQSVLYWSESLTDAPKLLIDPNTLSSDGTIALAGTSIDESGKLMAYGLAAAGSDWNEWKVRDVKIQQGLE